MKSAIEFAVKKAEQDVENTRTKLAREMADLGKRMALLASRLEAGDASVNRLGEAQAGAQIDRLCAEYELRKEGLAALKQAIDYAASQAPVDPAVRDAIVEGGLENCAIGQKFAVAFAAVGKLSDALRAAKRNGAANEVDEARAYLDSADVLNDEAR